MSLRWKDKADIATLAATDRIPVTDDVAGAATDKYTTPAEIKTYVETGTFTPGGTVACAANSVTGSAFAITGGTIGGVTLGITGGAITNCQIDNININGNTISSTDADGKIIIDTNGTGDINLTTAGGFVVFTEGDIKIGATALTATAAELNYCDGVLSQLAGLNEGLAQNIIPTTGSTATVSVGGIYQCDTSGLGGNQTLTMKAIASSKAERIMISCIDATHDVLINPNGSDTGFVDSGGTTAYTQIVLAAAGEFVILESSTITTKYWAIVGGKYSAT